MENEPKISQTEIALITPLFLLNDIIGVVLALVGLDDFFILDIIRFPLSQFYLTMKGIKGTSMLIGNILEVIPYVGALPNATIVWLITIYLDRHPKLKEKVEKAAGPIGKIAQKLPVK